MHKEYIATSANSIIVSENNGILTKRTISCDVEKLLVLENNLEFINKTIKDLQDFNKYPAKVKLELYKVAFHLMLYGIPAAAFASVQEYDSAIGLMAVGIACTAFDPIGKYFVELYKQHDIKQVDAVYKEIIKEAIQIKTNIEKEISFVKQNTTQTDVISTSIPKIIKEDEDFIDKISIQFSNTFDNKISKSRLRKRYNNWSI